MTKYNFPPKFIFGTAVASYQVEGGIYNNDWTHWENKSKTVCNEPCNEACKHFELVDNDIALLKDLGIKAFRFSIEWSRVEPQKGKYDQISIDHYIQKANKLIDEGIIPIITFHHFTTPEWLAQDGYWASINAADAFVKYVERMMNELPKEIKYFNTINEPGIFSMFGYFSKEKFPPGIRNEEIFLKTSDNIIDAHKRALKVIKSINKYAKVGMTHALHEWDDSDKSVFNRYLKYHLEDKFFFASEDDDFIGLQTYSIKRTSPNLVYRSIAWLLIKVPLLRNKLFPIFLDKFSGRNDYVAANARKTKMGYEYRPEAVKYNLHRIHDKFPDKDIFITENGIATDDDNERIQFVKEVLKDIHSYEKVNGRVIGYLYWSLLDNFEWDLGYEMNFGLIEVNKSTYERIPHPSAKWFGSVSATNSFTD
jgi:beta-glucosidase